MAWLKTRATRDEACERALAPVITIERRTLAECLGQGRLSASEGLRLALDAAQAIRDLHEDGRVHGALTPFAIELTPAGVELQPGRLQRGVPTPYTAPELLQGREPDARSDIFSFGAILFEIVTGRWPFEGDTPEALAASLQSAPVPRTGNATLDSLMTNCLAKEPAARWQHIRRAQLELKLASVFARQSEDLRRREQLDAWFRSEIQTVLESRVDGRLEAHQTALIDLRQTLAASAERMSRVERGLDTVERHSAEFAGSAATRLHALEQTVRAQAAALEAARAALAQTDDLVERVVEALDCLQNIVVERTGFVHGAMGSHDGLRTVQPISG